MHNLQRQSQQILLKSLKNNTGEFVFFKKCDQLDFSILTENWHIYRLSKSSYQKIKTRSICKLTTHYFQIFPRTTLLSEQHPNTAAVEKCSSSNCMFFNSVQAWKQATSTNKSWLRFKITGCLQNKIARNYWFGFGSVLYFVTWLLFFLRCYFS